MTGAMWYMSTNEMISPELFIIIFGGVFLLLLVGFIVSLVYKPEDDEEK